MIGSPFAGDRMLFRAVLDGWRGAKPADLDTLAKTIATLAAFAAAHADDVESIEINPFVALPEGGATLDALIQLRSDK